MDKDFSRDFPYRELFSKGVDGTTRDYYLSFEPALPPAPFVEFTKVLNHAWTCFCFLSIDEISEGFLLSDRASRPLDSYFLMPNLSRPCSSVSSSSSFVLSYSPSSDVKLDVVP